jgi:hypothetical protein
LLLLCWFRAGIPPKFLLVPVAPDAHGLHAEHHETQGTMNTFDTEVLIPQTFIPKLVDLYLSGEIPIADATRGETTRPVVLFDKQVA